MTDTTHTADIFLTAADAYPALEKQFIDARSTISAGFRVFDPRTKLRSEEGCSIGSDWYDLICHTLARGVRFRLILTDFDPVVRPAAHRMTWNAVRRFVSAAEASGRPDLLEITPAMQSARIGMGTAVALWPKALLEIKSETDRLNKLGQSEADRDIKMMPLLTPHIVGAHPRRRPKLRTLPRLVPTTHHQKIAVFDYETVYLGGLDLDERRYDTPEHARPAEDTWRDCQILTGGAIAQEAQAHLDEVLAVTAGRSRPVPTKHLLRTLSQPKTRAWFSMSPQPSVSEIEAAHIKQIKSAKTLIYLETQFFRSVPIARSLVQAAQENPSLELLLLLPAAPEDVAFDGNAKSDARYGEYLQAKCVDMVIKAFGERVFVAAPAQPRRSARDDRGALHAAPLIYVHAKVSIFDDTAAIVSSANLNGRSLRWDTEVGMALTDRQQVTALMEQCFEHWLPDGTAATPLPQVVETWRALANTNAKTPPDQRRGFLLPYPLAPARRFGKNLPGVPEEMA